MGVMIKNTFITAGVLILIGLVGYFGADFEKKHSITPLIPAFIGVAFALCGVVALKQAARKHAMHVAALLSVLGAMGAGKRIPKLLENDASALVLGSHIATTVTCIIFLIICIRSFVLARMTKK